MAALLFGIILITHMPFHFTYITLLSAIIGGAVGACFGLLIDYQGFVTGSNDGLIARADCTDDRHGYGNANVVYLVSTFSSSVV